MIDQINHKKNQKKKKNTWLKKAGLGRETERHLHNACPEQGGHVV